MDKTCDLVMKGGITSGVVYPKAILKLASEYRFQQIGGASAGAIAAAFTAAAEMNRDGDGFQRLAELPDKLGEGLSDLFQPYPAHSKLYKKVLQRVQAGKKFGIGFIVWNIRPIRKLLKSIESLHFGVCPGTTQDPRSGAGLTDWLNTQLEYVAGRIDGPNDPLPDKPLTFGMLSDSNVSLKLITTNLSRHRPETLPLRAGFQMKEDDLDTFLPTNVSKILRQNPREEDPTFFKIPDGQDMPVLLAVRMSLSFPLLFSAVPCYAMDFSLIQETPECAEQKGKPQLNLFSDGGISSNFPIHYFDHLIPTRPTFGISLEEHHECRQGKDSNNQPLWNRVYLPYKAGSGLTYSTRPINSLFGFFFSIVNSAKDWQDSLQNRMPGYRERVVHVYLKEDEGGLNLDMPPETISKLTELGGLAGTRILDGHGTDIEGQPKFSFDVHRWRRVLSVMAALEEEVPQMVKAYKEPDANTNSIAFEDYLRKLISGVDENIWRQLGYSPTSPEELQKLKVRIDKLCELKTEWDDLARDPNWNMPSPKANISMHSAEV